MHYMPCSSQTVSEILPENYTMEKCFFPQTYNSFSNGLILCYMRWIYDSLLLEELMHLHVHFPRIALLL